MTARLATCTKVEHVVIDHSQSMRRTTTTAAPQARCLPPGPRSARSQGVQPIRNVSVDRECHNFAQFPARGRLASTDKTGTDCDRCSQRCVHSGTCRRAGNRRKLPELQMLLNKTVNLRGSNSVIRSKLIRLCRCQDRSNRISQSEQ